MTDTPIYQIFDMIAQSGVGNLGNASLIIIQLIASMFFEIKFLFSSMKNRPPLVQLTVSIIPLLLIATYSIVCGLFFSAFMGKGPTLSEMTEIVAATLSEQSILQMLTAVGVFTVLMLVYSIVYKLSLWQWLATFGVEILAAFSLLTLYGGLLIQSFPYTILDLCAQDIYLARWPIYGYFTLMFKCFVLAFSLILGFALRERKEKPENEEEKYRDRHMYNERKVLRYLTKDNLLIGGGMLVFSAACELFFLWGIVSDEGVDGISAYAMVFLLFLIPAVIGILLVYMVLFPRKIRAYRQLLGMGNPETVMELFCKEIVDVKAPPASWSNGDTDIQTAHFVFRKQGIRQWVEWRGERL